jgi:negative regulator of flagellin synthesis FlgM
MKIQGQRSEVLRPASQTPSVQSPSVEAPKAQPTSGNAGGARGSDSVQISDAGRAMSTGEAGGSLTPERVAELRRRVLEGAYNANNVVNQVAKRILERGDV